MKSTYEKRWGHARFKKATAHFEVKAQKRREAETRNTKYQRLSISDKWNHVSNSPGDCMKQRAKIAAAMREALK